MSDKQKGSAVALGTFDGIHRGHRAVLKAAIESGYRPVAVTFSAPPKGSPCILTARDKLSYLKEIGFEEILVFEFEEIRDMPPAEFLNMLKVRLSPRMFCCGFNYRFGKNAEGNTAFLSDYCSKNGIELRVSQPIVEDGRIVSSTAVREMITSGKIEKANSLLYKPFGFSAAVSSGDHRGRLFGFPTVNQRPPEGIVLPRFGVYAARVLLDGVFFGAVTNFGIRPTYEVKSPLAETYIFGANGDLYGKNIRVSFLKFLRPERKFSSPEELTAAIDNDKKTAEEVLKNREIRE